MSHYRIYTLWLCIAIVLLTAALGFMLHESAEWNRVRTETSVERTFTPPQIPSSLTSPEERVEYLVGHYWNDFDFLDTTLISKPEITEQALSDFVSVLPYVTPERAGDALASLMASASVDSAMFLHFIDLAEKYLYDPNSPFRNEELYIPVLQYVVTSPKLDEPNKIRSQHQLDLALRNRPGDIATDFTYTLRDGLRSRMHALKADYTILFFNNPDCHDCQRVKEYMAASPVMERLGEMSRERVKLAILAVYPDGDVALWKQTRYPRGMINSYDAGQLITDRQLYDLKAIPTLYLLDRDKRVLLKDVPVEQIEHYLQNHE